VNGQPANYAADASRPFSLQFYPPYVPESANQLDSPTQLSRVRIGSADDARSPSEARNRLTRTPKGARPKW